MKKRIFAGLLSVGLCLGVSQTVDAGMGPSKIPAWMYSCPTNTRLRTNINTNGPNHYHGLGPNCSSITYYTKSAASSWSAWQSRQKWAYYNPSAAVVAAESGYGQTTGDDTNVQCVNP